MSENFNQQAPQSSNEALHDASIRGYLGKIAADAMHIGFVSSAIVGGTEVVSRVIGEGDHLSIPVATAMATAIFVSSSRRRKG